MRIVILRAGGNDAGILSNVYNGFFPNGVSTGGRTAASQNRGAVALDLIFIQILVRGVNKVFSLNI